MTDAPILQCARISRISSVRMAVPGLLGLQATNIPTSGVSASSRAGRFSFEILFLLQGEILKFAAAQRNLSFIFGIGRPHDDGMLCMHRLDEGGNQLRRAIAYNDMGGLRRIGKPIACLSALYFLSG